MPRHLHKQKMDAKRDKVLKELDAGKVRQSYDSDKRHFGYEESGAYEMREKA